MFLNDCQSIQPPVYCLMATLKEAKGILGKDVSGEFHTFMVWRLYHELSPTTLRRFSGVNYYKLHHDKIVCKIEYGYGLIRTLD